VVYIESVGATTVFLAVAIADHVAICSGSRGATVLEGTTANWIAGWSVAHISQTGKSTYSIPCDQRLYQHDVVRYIARAKAAYTYPAYSPPANGYPALKHAVVHFAIVRAPETAMPTVSVRPPLTLSLNHKLELAFEERF
jgi:hypothetical protein